MRLVQSLALVALVVVPAGALAQSGSRGGLAPSTAFAPAPVASAPFAGTPVTAFSPTSPAACCPQPTVAFAPVVPQVAAAPVVQQTTFTNGWYPGKYLTDFTRNLFGLNRTTTTYTAGYAPVTSNFAPTFANRVAYRPVYPASFGPVVPFTQTVSRPVVLSPVVSAPACNTCVASPCDCCGSACSGGSCSSCGGVSQAGFDAPLPPQAGQQPRLAPGDSVPPVRGERSIRQRPQADDFPPLPGDIETPDFPEDRPQGEPAATNSYWGAPPLFAPPSNRVTRNTHPAPVQTAVYRRAPASVQQTAYRSAKPRTGKVTYLSADGWTAAE